MKRLLVVVDYQNDFVDGALGFAGAELIEKNIISLIKEFESNGDDIVFTLDTHTDEYPETIEGKNLPVKHCIRGTKGWELTENLKPYAENRKIFEKPTFGSGELAIFAKEGKYDEIVFCGLVSDICVASNIVTVAAFVGPYTKLRIAKDATSSFDLEMQNKTFDVLKHLYIEIK